MKDETVNKILSETKHGYDMISKKFSQTRKHFWRNLEFIGDYTKDSDRVLDYGCGNGRLLELIGDKDIKYVGVDISEQLIEDATKHYAKNKFEFKKIAPGQDRLAFLGESFNTIYSIAVFHHFPSRKYREDVAKELYEKTKNGGYVIITVWYLWQEKYFKNIFHNWFVKIIGVSLPPHQFFEQLRELSFFKKIKFIFKNSGFIDGNWCGGVDWNDCLISFTNNEGKKFERFHHAFTKGELKKLFKKAGFEIKKCEIVDGRNIVLVGKK